MSRFAERIFFFSFIVFGVLNFIRVSPNGLISLAFVLLVLGICILALDTLMHRSVFQMPARRAMYYIFGPWLMLFGALSVSMAWSFAPTVTGMSILFEYRPLLLIPVVTGCLLLIHRSPEYVLRWMWISGTIGLAVVYVHRLVPFEGILYPIRPRGSHIIGGMILSLYVALSLWLSLCQPLRSRTAWVSIACALAASVYVVVLDSGRTGYLQIASVWIVYLFFVLPPNRRWMALIGVVLALLTVFTVFELPRQRVGLALHEAQMFFAGEFEPTSVGLRLQWLLIPIQSLFDGYWFGVGAGDYQSAIDHALQVRPQLFPTDNLHSEFANMTLMLGIPGFLLYAGLFIMPLAVCYRARDRISLSAHCLMAMVMSTLFVSSLFNSALKDFGEKNILMVMVPLAMFLVLSELRSTAGAQHRERSSAVGHS